MESLKVLRKHTSLTQDDVAKALRIPKSTYAHYESGRSEPDFKILIQLADYFGCSIDYLIGHQTSNIVHLDSWTPKERVANKMIKKLDDDQLTILLGYLAKMTNTPLEQLERDLSDETNIVL